MCFFLILSLFPPFFDPTTFSYISLYLTIYCTTLAHTIDNTDVIHLYYYSCASFWFCPYSLLFLIQRHFLIYLCISLYIAPLLPIQSIILMWFIYITIHVLLFDSVLIPSFFWSNDIFLYISVSHYILHHSCPYNR